jgi:hypothetical protein
LSVAEEHRVKYGGEDLVELRVDVVSMGVGGLVNSDSKEVGDQASKCGSINSIQDAREEVIEDGHTGRVSREGGGAVVDLSEEVERKEATEEEVVVKSSG